MRGIARHDDGWAARDAVPQITRQGKPSAFSTELVGKYSGFEEIDLVDYLAVRDRAVRLIAAEDPYAAILISMHTYSLLNDHADRSTIAPEQLPLFEQFLEGQKALQDAWRKEIAANPKLKPEHKSDSAILDHFRLLQANDYLSLLTCVDFQKPVNLLHALPTREGKHTPVQARANGYAPFCFGSIPVRRAVNQFSISREACQREAFFFSERIARRFRGGARWKCCRSRSARS